MKRFAFAAMAVSCWLPLAAQLPATPRALLPSDLQAKIDAAVAQEMADTGVPSADVGIVQNGRAVMTKAYGNARLGPPLPAAVPMATPSAPSPSSSPPPASCSCRRWQADPRRPRQPVVPATHPRQGRHPAQPALPHLAATRTTRRRTTPSPPGSTPPIPSTARTRVGRQAARLRARHPVAVQQHQLRAALRSSWKRSAACPSRVSP